MKIFGIWYLQTYYSETVSLFQEEINLSEKITIGLYIESADVVK